MLAVVVTLCLKADPAACSDHVVVWVPKQSEELCLASAKSAVDAFAQSYPQSVVGNTACMPGRR